MNHTPNRNQNSRRPDLRAMSPEERARYEAYVQHKRAQKAREVARQAEIEKAKRAKERAERAKIFRGRLIVFGIVFVFLLLVVLAVFLIFFKSAPDAPDSNGKISFFYGGEKIREESAENCILRDGVYLCFNDIANYIGMAESGNADSMKFVLRSGENASSAEGTGKEETVIFSSDGYDVTINGQNVKLEIPNIVRQENVWVSLSFVEKYMNGLAVSYLPKKKTVNIAKIKDDTLSVDDEVVFQEVSFTLKAAFSETPISEDPLVGDVIYNENGDYKLDFVTDLSEYEEYMNPQGEMRDAFLVLVNTKNLLTADDIPDDLVDVKYTSTAKKTQQLRLYAYKALDALYQEMHAAGFYDMAVYSGYRSYSYQSALFNQYVQNEMAANPNLTEAAAEKIVLTYSTKPGTSEHQTGLAVDMDNSGAFSTDFANTEEYKWLENNAWKFGFILRFPKDKVDITTIQFEPWHFRYVGRYHALKIHESGLCLEEYLAELKK